MQGAWFSGERAAEAVLAHPNAARVIVVGAGLAGLACARRLQRAGRTTIVLEKTDHLGGRASVDTSLGIPLPLGGAWLHGEVGHPLASRVSYRSADWTDDTTFLIGHGAVGEADLAAASAALEHVQAMLAAAPADQSAAQVLPRALASLDLSPVVRETVHAWFTDEIENLYGAPLDDFPAAGLAEEYMLPGDNQLITSSLAPVFDELADGLDVRFEHRVASLTLQGASWRTDTAVVADAVVVTAPVAALRAGRIRFAPPLPAAVLDAFAHLGAGPVAKVFATYRERWWPDVSVFRIAGGSPFAVVADMTDLTGVPTLSWFAVGESARRVETMSEDERCRLLDRVAAESGLADWDLA
jgi:monoamine oxidase